MKDFKQIEYEQLSQDWRHRDVLTWQLPSVLVIGTGILVGEAFSFPQGLDSWIQSTVLGLAAGLALCLTVALVHNLFLQHKNATALKALAKHLDDSSEAPADSSQGTKRVGFVRIASLMFCVLAFAQCALLVVLCYLSVAGRLNVSSSASTEELARKIIDAVPGNNP